MNRKQTLQLLAEHKSWFASRFGVTDLALFGSAVRAAARVASDVDIFLVFDGTATSDRYLGAQFFREDLLA